MRALKGVKVALWLIVPHLAIILNKTRREKLINICLDSGQYWCVYTVIWEVYHVGSL